MAENHLLPKIGFIGAGRMAAALTQSLLRTKLTKPERIMASDIHGTPRDNYQATTGIKALDDNKPVAEWAEILVIAIKPQVIDEVLAELKPVVTSKQLIMSIAAGIRLEQLQSALGNKPRIVRIMPNTPCLVGAGASGFCLGHKATLDDAVLVQKILGSGGKAYELPERLMDAVTGLSGSGPAFVAVVVDALADGGVRMGLPRDVATNLATQTVYGTAKMLLETGLHPGMLKDMVASPGGTTMAGIHALEQAGLRASLMDAVEAATLRATELGQNSRGM